MGKRKLAPAKKPVEKRGKETKTQKTVECTKTGGGGPKVNEASDDSTEDDEEEPTQSWRGKTRIDRMTSQQKSREDTTTLYPREQEGSISSIQDESLTVNSEAKMRSLEGRINTMEAEFHKNQNEGQLSVVSGNTVAPPSNEKLMVENLRTFVAAKVFPSWKFIFKKELLLNCVASAISKHFITVPPGFDTSQLAERYCTTVRASLDGCRANAQTAARKRCLSK